MKEQKEAKESREQAIRFKDEYDTKLKRIDKDGEHLKCYLKYKLWVQAKYSVIIL